MKRIGTIPEEGRLAMLADAKAATFKHTPNGTSEGYWVSMGVDKSMFVKIRRGGSMHSHRDTTGVRDQIRVQYVLQTNPDAKNYVEDEIYNLEQGGIYELESQYLHWADNNGDEDRIHLVLF
jgi:aspartyl/asparaginyl beta-hydroxylase (cupin superfamily)